MSYFITSYSWVISKASMKSWTNLHMKSCMESSMKSHKKFYTWNPIKSLDAIWLVSCFSLHPKLLPIIPITAWRSRPTFHKSAKNYPPACPRILRKGRRGLGNSMTKMSLHEAATDIPQMKGLDVWLWMKDKWKSIEFLGGVELSITPVSNSYFRVTFSNKYQIKKTQVPYSYVSTSQDSRAFKWRHSERLNINIKLSFYKLSHYCELVGIILPILHPANE